MSASVSGIVTKAFIDTFEIIYSGIVNMMGSEFSVTIDDLELQFLFSVDTNCKTASIKTSVVDPENKKLKIEMLNVKNPNAEGIYDPMIIGEIDGRQLAFTLSSWTVKPDKNIRTVAYNVLLSKEAKHE